MEVRLTTQRQLAQGRDRLMGQLEWLLEDPAAPPHMGIYTWSACWEDWLPEPLAIDAFPAPVYTVEEFEAIVRTCAALEAFWDAFDGEDEDGVKLPEWATLTATARQSLSVLMARGRLTDPAD